MTIYQSLSETFRTSHLLGFGTGGRARAHHPDWSRTRPLGCGRTQGTETPQAFTLS